jgi:hypothetical protein
MTTNTIMRMCNEHNMPLLYRGDDCPWCGFIALMEDKLITEYKRGFGDGVKALEIQMEKEKQAATEVPVADKSPE